MKSLLEEVKRRVHAPGPFAAWKHEASNSARYDLRNVLTSSRAVFDFADQLQAGVRFNRYTLARQAAFGLMHNLYPIVEALDTDAGQYLAQAAEALRK